MSKRKLTAANKKTIICLIAILVIVVAVLIFGKDIIPIGKILETVGSDLSDIAEVSTNTQQEPAQSREESYRAESDTAVSEENVGNLTFASKKLLTEHYNKHGIEMGFKSEEAYVKAANAVVSNPKSLHKTEAEDGDDVYYLESTNEFVVVSTAGYIRTYFLPSAGKSYFDRQ